jgi:hypothetical protein
MSAGPLAIKAQNTKPPAWARKGVSLQLRKPGAITEASSSWDLEL